MTLPLAAETAATLAEAVEVAARQAGGVLGTIHAETGAPCVTFVFFHLDEQGRLLFGSNMKAQHTRNLMTNPAASFLVDARHALPADWDAFDRVAVEGEARVVDPGSPEYAPLMEAFRGKNRLAARFTENGHLFCLQPRRLTLHRGIRTPARTIEFGDRRS